MRSATGGCVPTHILVYFLFSFLFLLSLTEETKEEKTGMDIP
jgi:hypothetical protein